MKMIYYQVEEGWIINGKELAFRNWSEHASEMAAFEAVKGDGLSIARVSRVEVCFIAHKGRKITGSDQIGFRWTP